MVLVESRKSEHQAEFSNFSCTCRFDCRRCRNWLRRGRNSIIFTILCVLSICCCTRFLFRRTGVKSLPDSLCDESRLMILSCCNEGVQPSHTSSSAEMSTYTPAVRVKII